MPGAGGSKVDTVEQMSAVLEMKINELALPVRVTNCLETEFRGMPTVRQVVLKSEMEFLRIRNFGRRSLNELKGALAERGLHVGMPEEELPKPALVSGPEYKFPVSSGPSREDLSDFVVRALAGAPSTECMTVWVGDPFNVIDHEYHIPVSDEDLKILAQSVTEGQSFEIEAEEEKAFVTLDFDPTTGRGTITIIGKKPA